MSKGPEPCFYTVFLNILSALVFIFGLVAPFFIRDVVFLFWVWIFFLWGIGAGYLACSVARLLEKREGDTT
jgi:hypothetical protein